MAPPEQQRPRRVAGGEGETNSAAAESSSPILPDTQPQTSAFVYGGGNMTAAVLRRLIEQIDIDEQMRQRSVQQAILQAESWFWAWRAEQFHAAAPQPDDYFGQATSSEVLEAHQRCRETALACLRHAQLLAEMADESNDDDI